MNATYSNRLLWLGVMSPVLTAHLIIMMVMVGIALFIVKQTVTTVVIKIHKASGRNNVVL
jgi:hypothetical protein